MSEPRPRTQLLVIAVLLVLLGLSILASQLPLGPLKPVVALGIAIIKAILIGLFFMHLRYRDRRFLVFAMAGLAWLALLFTFTLADYFTRQLDAPVGAPRQRIFHRPR